MNSLKNLAKKLLLVCASLGAVGAILLAPSEAQAGRYRYLAVQVYTPRPVVYYRAPAVVVPRRYPGIYYYTPAVGIRSYGRIEYVPQFVPGPWLP